MTDHRQPQHEDITTIIGAMEASRSALDAPSDTSLRVPCYCEENVWRLAYRKLYHEQQKERQTNHRNNNTTTNYFVVFVSNPKGCVPMFQQMASPRKDKPVFWDYHVILLSTTTTATTTANNNNRYTQSECRVWDIDSYLSLPCCLEDYIQNVFPNYAHWPQEYAPYFRVVDAFAYLKHFSSDRMHMYDQQTKRWSATPPTYDCIIIMRRQHNVNRAPKQQQGKHGESSENGSNRKNNTDATKTGFTAASNLKQYMTISDDDVRCRRRNSSGEHRHNGDNEEDSSSSSSSSSQMYGKIYSLSELLERFAGATVPPPSGRS
jgi:hypothetical protein